MCDNKEDLKWCKAASMWTVPDNWIQLAGSPYSLRENFLQEKCTFQNETDPRGQWINPENKMDHLVYHCINRADEDPFSKKKEMKNWLDWVNSPCDNSEFLPRRCLGNKPSQCVKVFDGGWGIGTIILDAVSIGQGHNGCLDNSGISMLPNKSSNQCVNTYYKNQYIDHVTIQSDVPVPVDWTWFYCKETQRCIHNSHRCNLHPHPDCIYEKDGMRVAEDEEGCFEEYKRKGLIEDSANFICQSQLHNEISVDIFSTVAAFREFLKRKSYLKL